MAIAFNQQHDVTYFVAAIARSPIAAASSGRCGSSRLPDGYDEIDAAILVWIAAGARRAARTFNLM